MTNVLTPEMPRAWEDHARWETYYQLLPLTQRRDAAHSLGFLTLNNLPRFGSQLHNAKVHAIWVPGCGCSLLGHLLARYGFESHVTDIAPSAIAFQHSTESQELATSLFEQAEKAVAATEDVPTEVPQRPSTLTAKVHNFCMPYEINKFNIILNIKAFQGFTPDNQRIIARTHFQALRPQGTAFFQTQNVQGSRRDILESALADAGFYVPLFETNRWHRRALSDTGIPHIFILGRPMIPIADEYADDKQLWERDMATLQRFEAEWKERAAAEFEASKTRREDPEIRFAQPVHCTG